MNDINRYRGCLIGLAVGDALGVPLEFSQRDTLPVVTEMIGQGPFYLKPGEWTDDTSMALCLGQSLLDCNGFDPKDQMDKYWKWIEAGYMSSTGEMFDIGNATSDALCKYRKTGNPYAGSDDPQSSGNGSLMRLAPIPMFFKTRKACGEFAYRMSQTTHASSHCVYACEIYADMIWQALSGVYKNDIINSKQWPVVTKPRDKIESTGFVLHTLESAMWSFYNSTSFEEGAILAVNLAEDSDTTGAVYGQLAGAYYGYESIPKRWLDKIVKLDMIVEMADKLYEHV